MLRICLWNSIQKKPCPPIWTVEMFWQNISTYHGFFTILIDDQEVGDEVAGPDDNKPYENVY